MTKIRELGLKTDIDTDHHRPRKIDKKKHHRKGYSEDVQDKRNSRLNFKRYLLEMEEQLLDKEIDDAL